jgi:hypothetical protein
MFLPLSVLKSVEMDEMMVTMLVMMEIYSQEMAAVNGVYKNLFQLVLQVSTLSILQEMIVRLQEQSVEIKEWSTPKSVTMAIFF